MRKAIDNGYRVPESHLRLGMALGMTGRFDEAQGSLDEALSRDSGLATAYYYKGLFLFQEGEALAAGPGRENPYGIHALRLLERSQAMTPNPRTALVLSEAYLRVGQQMRALEAAAEALQTPRLAPEALRFQAVAHHELLEYEAAEKTYRAAIEAGADSAELYHDFGNLLSVMGRSEEAKGMLEEALSRDGDYPGAHLQIGIAYVNLREFEKALTHLERFLAFAPASAEGWYQKGLVESRRSNPEAAVASWRKALELDPGQSRLLYRLGAELVKLGRVEERTALLTKFEERQKQAELASQRGEALQNLLIGALQADDDGDDARAFDLLRQAQQLAPEDARPYVYTADFYLTRGQHSDASTVLNDGLVQLPDDLSLHQMLLSSFQAAGNDAGVARERARIQQLTSRK